jgi:hypothetical protein
MILVVAACTTGPTVPMGPPVQQPTLTPASESQSIVPSTSTSASPSTSGLAHYSDNGISFDYPASWQLRPENVLLRTGPVFAFIGTAPSQMSCGSSTEFGNCTVGWNLQPGTVSVELVSEESPPLPEPLYELPIQSGSTHVAVGGLPAIMTTAGFGSGGDMEISWAVTTPGSPDSAYGFMVAAMDPGTHQARQQVEALIASVQFVPPVEPLPSGAERDAAIARALTTLAAHDQSFVCFPTTIGQSADAVIQYFPAFSKLRKPVPVRCSTDVEETPIDLWRLTLTISWDAAKDRTAGTNVTHVWVDPTGEPGLAYGGGPDSPPYWP